MIEENVKYTCDGCGKIHEQGPSNYPHTYLLELRTIDIRTSSESGIVYSIAMYPPIERRLHFCNVKCISTWRLAEDEKTRKWELERKEKKTVGIDGVVLTG